MKGIPAQGMTMALIYTNVKRERKVIIEDIEGMKNGLSYDLHTAGYNNALDDVIAMIAAKNEED